MSEEIGVNVMRLPWWPTALKFANGDEEIAVALASFAFLQVAATALHMEKHGIDGTLPWLEGLVRAAGPQTEEEKAFENIDSDKDMEIQRNIEKRPLRPSLETQLDGEPVVGEETEGAAKLSKDRALMLRLALLGPVGRA
jgi:hypothetical protein